jgi:hypothetical protein
MKQKKHRKRWEKIWKEWRQKEEEDKRKIAENKDYLLDLLFTNKSVLWC